MRLWLNYIHVYIYTNMDWRVFAHLPIKHDPVACHFRVLVRVFAWNNKGKIIPRLLLLLYRFMSLLLYKQTSVSWWSRLQSNIYIYTCIKISVGVIYSIWIYKYRHIIHAAVVFIYIILYYYIFWYFHAWLYNEKKGIIIFQFVAMRSSNRWFTVLHGTKRGTVGGYIKNSPHFKVIRRTSIHLSISFTRWGFIAWSSHTSEG